MTQNPFHPFRGPQAPELSLSGSNLVAVLSQITFPTALSVENETFTAEFQKRVKDRFPVLSRGNRVEFDNGAVRNKTAWNFHTSTGEWVLSLTSDFISLHCGCRPDANGSPQSAYHGKADFVSRLGDAFEAAADIYGIDQMTRMGVRQLHHGSISLQSNYVSDFINPELLITSAAGVGGHHIRSTASGQTDEGFANVNWGTVIPGHTADLGGIAVGPNPGDSWFIDIDSFSALGSPMKTTPALVRGCLDALSGRANSLFNWVASKDMLKRLEAPKTDQPRLALVAKQLH
jgi:uncharacterized protein (TIGR04255 family)